MCSWRPVFNSVWQSVEGEEWARENKGIGCRGGEVGLCSGVHSVVGDKYAEIF